MRRFYIYINTLVTPLCHSDTAKLHNSPLCQIKNIYTKQKNASQSLDKRLKMTYHRIGSIAEIARKDLRVFAGFLFCRDS